MTEYNVVTRTLIGPSKGAVTWTTFKDEREFDEWYTKRMNDGTDIPVSEVYKVIEKGVSHERALELADATPPIYDMRAKVGELLPNLDEPSQERLAEGLDNIIAQSRRL